MVGGFTVDRTRMNLFNRSNQKGAPRDTAVAVRAKPMIFISHPMGSSDCGTVPAFDLSQPSGNPRPRRAFNGSPAGADASFGFAAGFEA